MDTSAYNSLLMHVRTKAEADSLLAKIDELTSSLYQLHQVSFSELVQNHLPSMLAEGLNEALRMQQLSFEHPDDLKTYLQALKQILQNMHTVILTISFSPSDEALSAIAQKAKSLFGQNTLIELHVQESIIGGAIVVNKGRFSDYSLQAKLAKVFQTHTKEIMDILKEENRV